MRIPCTLLLACTLFATAAAARDAADTTSSAAEGVGALIDRIQLRYADAASVHSRFVQRATNVALAETTEAVGECWFAKPGKMRWIYERPEPQTLVSDGGTLWFYQPTRYQVTISAIPPELASRIPTAFFSGTGDLGEDYDAKEVFPEAADAPRELRVVDLTPKDDGDPVPFRKLRIEVDTGSALVRAIEIHDLFGNVNRLEFTDIELLDEVDDALFAFEVPEGTHVVRP